MQSLQRLFPRQANAAPSAGVLLAAMTERGVSSLATAPT